MTEVFWPLSHYRVVWAVRVLARVSCSPWWDPISLQGPLLSQLLFHSHNQGTFFFSSSVLQTTWAVSQHEGAVSSPWSKFLLNKFLMAPIWLGTQGFCSLLPHIALWPSLLKVAATSHYTHLQVALLSMFGFQLFHFLCKQSFYQI